jgi:hypothetical protein
MNFQLTSKWIALENDIMAVDLWGNYEEIAERREDLIDEVCEFVLDSDVHVERVHRFATWKDKLADKVAAELYTDVITVWLNEVEGQERLDRWNQLAFEALFTKLEEAYKLELFNSAIAPVIAAYNEAKRCPLAYCEFCDVAAILSTHINFDEQERHYVVEFADGVVGDVTDGDTERCITLSNLVDKFWHQ